LRANVNGSFESSCRRCQRNKSSVMAKPGTPQLRIMAMTMGVKLAAPSLPLLMPSVTPNALALPGFKLISWGADGGARGRRGDGAAKKDVATVAEEAATTVTPRVAESN
jgi:hypothetical protein